MSSNTRDDDGDNDFREQEYKKFIGGAEKARRKAREFLRKNNNHPNQRNQHYYGNNSKSNKTAARSKFKALPKRGLKASERFYASLLQHDVQTILQSDSIKNGNSNGDNWNTFMTNTCEHTLNIPIPQALPKVYRNNDEYYTKLSSLVIEEARCILVDALLKQQRKKNKNLQAVEGRNSYKKGGKKRRDRYSHGSCGNNGRNSCSSTSGDNYVLHLIHVQKHEKHDFLSMTFAKPCSRSPSSQRHNDNINQEKNQYSYEPFTPKELYDMKPGCIFQVTIIDEDGGRNNGCDNDEMSTTMTNQKISFLASVVPKASGGRSRSSNNSDYSNNSVNQSSIDETLPLMMYNYDLLSRPYKTNSTDTAIDYDNRSNIKTEHSETILDFILTSLSTKIIKCHVSPCCSLISGKFGDTAVLKMYIFMDVFIHQNESLLRFSHVLYFQFDFQSMSMIEQRQFEACMKKPNVSFMYQLLGMKSSTHIRFEDSDSSSGDLDSDSEENIKKNCFDKNNEVSESLASNTNGEEEIDSAVSFNTSLDYEINDTERVTLTNNSSLLLDSEKTICIPTLNDTQEKAAQSFMNSSSSTITLVQV